MKIPNFHRIVAYYPVYLPKWKFCQYKWKTVQKLKLNFSRSALFHTNTKVCLIYFGQDCGENTKYFCIDDLIF